MHLPRLSSSYQLFIGLAKPTGDATPPAPVTGPADSSSSELGTIPSQADDRGMNQVRVAAVKTTDTPPAAASEMPDDSLVAKRRIDCYSSGTPRDAATGNPKNAMTTEKAATTARGKPPATTGLRSWIVITLITLIVYPACLYLGTGLTSLLAPSSNSYTDIGLGTGLTTSRYESSEGIPMDSTGASEFVVEEPVAVTAASPTDLDTASVEQDQMQARASEKRILDTIDRALGWKGR